MTKTMLKAIRLLSPGVIILLCLLPFTKPEATKQITEALSGDVCAYIVIIVVIFLGAVYYSFDFRGFLWRPIVTMCHENVRDTIIIKHYSDPIVKSKIHLITNEVVIRIFYNIVDNDPSLTDQAHDVRHNGAILSTMIDGILILPFFLLIHLAVFYFSGTRLCLAWAIAILVLQVVLLFARPRLLSKHLHLQNEQLAVIAQHHNNTVLSKLQNL
jgi:hypothetical protein